MSITARERLILDWQKREGAEAWWARAVAMRGEDYARAVAASYAEEYDAAADKRPKAVRDADG